MSEINLLPNGTWRMGSRGSSLALWQTYHVRDLFQVAWPEWEVTTAVFSTRGDQILDTPLPIIGGKGLFTAELEAALRGGTIDAAVHSLKDLPTETPEGLIVGAIPERENPADVLVCRARYNLATLPKGAAVGTSSRRRAAQLLHLRPDLTTLDIRGNVPTRIRKVMDPEGPYDAVILAYAGLARLDKLDVVSQIFSPEEMLPAPGQGALAVQCRDDARSRRLLAPLEHPQSRVAVTAERHFLNGLGGGCSLPIAAHAALDGERLTLWGRVTAPDGSEQIEVQISGKLNDARKLGIELAKEALGHGAARLIGEVK